MLTSAESIPAVLAHALKNLSCPNSRLVRPEARPRLLPATNPLL